MANNENLIPLNKRTKAEQRAIAVKGGIKSGKVRQEKKLMSQMYAEFLAKKHNVVIKGKTTIVTGQELVNGVVSKVLSRGKSESVSMLKEIREATEGNKSILMNQDGSELFKNGININFVEEKSEL